MGASNYPGLAIPKPPPPNRKKRENRKVTKRQRRSAFDLVDERDKGRCQLTGRRAAVNSVDPLDRIHHHHIIELSACGPDETWNIVSVIGQVHELQRKNLITVWGNADEQLVWTVRADVVVEAFGSNRVPEGVRVVAVEDWDEFIRTEARVMADCGRPAARTRGLAE
jgi:hypothetical protein